MPAFLKRLVLKNDCMCKGGCRFSGWIKHGEKSTNKSSSNQDKIATVLKTYLNDFKKYLTTFQVVILCKSSCKSIYCNFLNPCKLYFFINRVLNLDIVIF